MESRAPLMAMPPRSEAERLESEPDMAPIGVRLAATMYTDWIVDELKE